MKRVGFFPRLLAAILDMIILMILVYIVNMLTGSQLSTDPSQMFGGDGPAIPLSGIVIALLYTSLEIWMAATPGKMILKLKIKNVKGKNGTSSVLFIRWIFKQSAQILSLLFVLTHIQPIWYLQSLLGIVIFVGCFFTLGKNKQALHDMLAKTAVYKGK